MRVRTILLFILYVVLVICLTPVLAIFILFRIRSPLYSIGKGVMRLSQKMLGLELRVTGLDHVDRRKSVIFMGNHVSFIDGPLLFTLIPHQVRVILKKEIFRIPVVGTAMRHLDFVPVDRKGFKGGKVSLERAARLMKDRGYSFLIFPEGTRSLDGNLHRFKRGGFFLAVESRATIVPVAIKGTFELMPKGKFFVKRGRIRVAFLPPVSVEGYSP
jgi:1-acyl-sn-glycerol-3-phosphate acyltransferase